MRVEAREVGSINHVVNRGTRGMAIVRDIRDKMRFAKSLFYLNDSFSDPNWTQALKSRESFERPAHWPDRDPLVRVLAWTLMPNHFHLLLEEIRENGIAKFMQRLCGSMSAAFNARYEERGSIFQGSYKSRTVEQDTDLRYLIYYIQVKNVLELYPGGLRKALSHFDDAWEWVCRYRFSSLISYVSDLPSPIIEKGRLFELLSTDARLDKSIAQEMTKLHLQTHNDKYADLALEPW